MKTYRIRKKTKRVLRGRKKNQPHVEEKWIVQKRMIPYIWWKTESECKIDHCGSYTDWYDEEITFDYKIDAEKYIWVRYGKLERGEHSDSFPEINKE